MSSKLQGKIHRYDLIAYANAIGVIASKEAIRTAKHLFLAFAEHYNDETGQCNPSIPSLMKCIELSHGPTVNAKNLLIRMGLVSVIKNARGGRHSCWYELHFPRYAEFSRPTGNTPSHPVKRMPKIDIQNPSHPIYRGIASEKEEVSHPDNGRRILIETLDIPLIKSLKYVKNKDEQSKEILRLAKKYCVPMSKDTAMWQVEDYLLESIKIQNL